MDFQTNLRCLRKAKGLTQQEMADIFNLQRQSYCNYENGHRMPPMVLLVAMADFFSVSLDVLVRGTVALEDQHNPTLPVLTRETIYILTAYQKLPPSTRKELIDYLTFKLERLSD